MAAKARIQWTRKTHLHLDPDFGLGMTGSAILPENTGIFMFRCDDNSWPFRQKCRCNLIMEIHRFFKRNGRPVHPPIRSGTKSTPICPCWVPIGHYKTDHFHDDRRLILLMKSRDFSRLPSELPEQFDALIYPCLWIHLPDFQFQAITRSKAYPSVSLSPKHQSFR